MIGYEEGCRVVFVTVLITFIVAALIGLVASSFIDRKHCRKCNRLIEHENYCPNCGTKTDSVLIYDFWNKP